MQAKNLEHSTRQTFFHSEHLKLGANMVPFAGWSMPLHYGSQLKEHESVRNHAGMFDVSHMSIIDIKGDDCYAYLRKVLANDIAKIESGQALYGCMLNEQGGIIDDLITYKLDDTHYRVVVNAATTTKDARWLEDKARGFKVHIELMSDLGLLAVQGPKARAIVAEALPEAGTMISDLKPFRFANHKQYMMARTGYTGEDGLEIAAEAQSLINLWQKLLSLGVQPAGLGARDTLRLEAGLNLYGTDMDESTTPYESNLGWTVDLKDPDRDFYGRAALEQHLKEGPKRKMVGLVLNGQGIIRNHMPVTLANSGKGQVTSGGFSPTMKKSIALARIPNEDCDHLTITIRNKEVEANCVNPPFVRLGKIRV